jgi:hypothetical protein
LLSVTNKLLHVSPNYSLGYEASRMHYSFSEQKKNP